MCKQKGEQTRGSQKMKFLERTEVYVGRKKKLKMRRQRRSIFEYNRKGEHQNY